MINMDDLFNQFDDLSKGIIKYSEQAKNSKQFTQLINNIISAYIPGKLTLQVRLEGSDGVLYLKEKNNSLQVTWHSQIQDIAAAPPSKRAHLETKTALFSVSTLKGFIDRCQLQRWLFPELYGLNAQQREALSFENADLSAMHLNRRDLSGMNLTNANLSNTRLDETNLSGATLNGADCRSDDPTDESVLGGARNVTLIGTRSSVTIEHISQDGMSIDSHERQDLAGLKIRGAKFDCLSAIDMSDAELSNVYFNGDMRDVRLDRSNLAHGSFNSGKTIQDVDLINANLTHFTIPPLRLINVNFDGADLSHAIVDRDYGQGLYWSNVSFRDTRWIEADLSGADFRNRGDYRGDASDSDSIDSENSSDFDSSGVDLHRADFTRARMVGGNFTEADFTEANFSDAVLVEFWDDGRPRLPLFKGAQFHGATFGRRVNILGLIGADLHAVNFNDTEVYIGVRKLTDACLDTLFNHHANDRSLMQTIDSLHNAALKVNLMEQLIGMVSREDINLQPFLKNFDMLFQPHYFKSQTIQQFFTHILAPQMMISANNAPWNISDKHVEVLCHAFWDLIDSKPGGDFGKFVLKNNEFFIQLVCQSRKNGSELLKQRAEMGYAKYLVLPRIREYTRRADNVFGDLHQSVDWSDEEARNYILVADSAQEKKTLMLSEKKLAALLYKHNHSLKVWVTDIIYYLKGVNDEEPALVLLAPDLLKNVFNNDFKAFSAAYHASAMASQQGQLWELFSWEQARQKDYRTLFMQTVASGQGPKARFTDLRNQTELLIIFEKAFPLEQQLRLREHVKAMSDVSPRRLDDLLPQSSQADIEHQYGFSLDEVHYQKLLNVLALVQCTDSEKAQSLISLAIFFTHLSSSEMLGTETGSPLALRCYASALLDRAQALDTSVFVASPLTSGEDLYKRWQNKLLGEGGAFTCTAVLYEEMKAYARRNFQPVFDQVNAVLKPTSVSGFASDSLSDAGLTEMESDSDTNVETNRQAGISWEAQKRLQAAHQAVSPEATKYDYNLIIPFLAGEDDSTLDQDADPATREAINRAVQETFRALEAIAEENGIQWKNEPEPPAAVKTNIDIKGAAGALFKKHLHNSFIAWLEQGEFNTVTWNEAAGIKGSGGWVAQNSLPVSFKESARVRWQLLLHDKTVNMLGAVGVKAVLDNIQYSGALKPPARIVLVICGLSEWSEAKRKTLAKTLLMGYSAGTPLVLYHAPAVAIHGKTGRKHLDGEAYIYRLDENNELLLPVHKERSGKLSFSTVTTSVSEAPLYPLGDSVENRDFDALFDALSTASIERLQPEKQQVFSALVQNIIKMYNRQRALLSAARYPEKVTVMLEGKTLILEEKKSAQTDQRDIAVSWQGKEQSIAGINLATLVVRLQTNMWRHAASYGLPGDGDTLTALLRNIDWHNADLRGLYLGGADLRGFNFGGTYLEGVNLTGAYLSRADLRGIYLEGACFSRADLSRANFTGANLTGADFSHTDSRGADFEGVYLNRANLMGANLTGANLTGAYLSRADLKEADLSKANLMRTYLSHADLTNANLAGADLSRADLSGADFTGANLSEARVTLRLPAEWNEVNLDTYLNHVANNGRSLITAINSIDARFIALKVSLMRQLIVSLEPTITPNSDRQNSASIGPAELNLQPFRESLLDCIQPDYMRDKTIAHFLKTHVIKPLVKLANEGPWRTENADLCQGLLSWVQEKKEADFRKFVLNNNGFFIQLIANSRSVSAGNVREQVEAPYRSYLGLDRINQYTRPEYSFGNLDGVPEWKADDSGDCINYILTADRQVDVQGQWVHEKHTLLLSEKQLNAMLRGNEETDWTSFMHYLQQGQGTPENQPNHQDDAYLRSLFSTYFKLFSVPYSSAHEHKNILALLNVLNLGDYRELFVRALKSGRMETKLTGENEQLALNEIFKPLLVQRSGEDGRVPAAIKEVHYQDIQRIFYLANKPLREQAGVLVMLATLFTHYSSSSMFGEEAESPQILRTYAALLLDRAKQLDAGIDSLDGGIGHLNDWQNRLLGHNGAFTCTSILSGMMQEYGRRYLTAEANGIIPVSWRTRAGHLGGMASDNVRHNAVARWLLPASAVKRHSGGATRYMKQLIIQLEDDELVREAAVSLLDKHPGKSLLVQLDAAGHYRVLKRGEDGFWLVLPDSQRSLREAFTATAGKIRWQLVGHGRNVDGETSLNNSTLAYLTPDVLAENLKTLSVAINKEPDHISLVGCALTDETDFLASYAGRVIQELGERTLPVETLSARTEIVQVAAGRKVFRNANTFTWRSPEKFIFYRKDGELKGVKVGKKEKGREIQRLLQEADQNETLGLNNGSMPEARERLQAKAHQLYKNINQLWQQSKLPHQLTIQEMTGFLTFFPESDHLPIEIAGQTTTGKRARESIQMLLDTGIGTALQDLSGHHAVQLVQEINSKIWQLPQHTDSQQNTVTEFTDNLMHSRFTGDDINRRIETATRINTVLGITGRGVQGLGLGAGIGTISANRRLIRSGLLSKEKIAALEAQNAVSLAEMNLDFGADIVNVALGKWESYMAKNNPAHSMMKPLPPHFKLPPEMLKRLAGISKLGKAASVVLSKYGEKLLCSGITRISASGNAASSLFNLAGAALGWYAFHQIVEELKTETESARRTDLYVNAGLTLASAITSTVVAGVITAAAAGAITGAAFAGTAATLAGILGPLGLTLGAATLLAGWIYNGIRQVEEISKAVNLNGIDTFRAGFLSLFGSLPADIQIRYDFNQISRQISQRGVLLLENNEYIDTLYYSPLRVLPGTVIPSSKGAAWAKKNIPFYKMIDELFIKDVTKPVVQQTDDYLDLTNNIARSSGVTDASAAASKMSVFRPLSEKIASMPETGNYAQKVLFLNANRQDARKIAYFDGRLIRVLDKDETVISQLSAPVNFLPEWILVGNVAGDEEEEILFIDPDTHYVATLAAKNGHYSFFINRKNTHALPAMLLPPLLADINNNGYHDVLLVTTKSIEIIDFSGDSNYSLTFSTTGTVLADKNYRRVLTGDINGDGCTDIVVITDTGTVYTLLNSGKPHSPFSSLLLTEDSRLTRLLQSHSSDQNSGILLSDRNQDRQDDLTIIDENFHVAVAHGKKNGQFAPPVDLFPARPGYPQLMNHRITGIDGDKLYSVNNRESVYTHSLRDTVSLVMLEQGTDTFLAPDETSGGHFVFFVDKGIKDFVGGLKDDVFTVRDDPAQISGLLDGHDGEDTLSLSSVNPGENPSGYTIHLGSANTEGYLIDGHHSDAAQPLLKLKNLEHAEGHADTNDLLIGNHKANRLNGCGGKDKIEGHEGNDDITLAEGEARGGAGNDIYHILPNRKQDAVEVLIQEVHDPKALSTLFLMQKITQLSRPIRENDNLVMHLSNDQNNPVTRQETGATRLILQNFYTHAAQGQHTFRVITRDGFSFTLSASANGLTSSERLSVQYDAALDSHFQSLTATGHQPPEIELVSNGEQNSRTLFTRKEITVVHDRVALPDFMQLSLQDTRFDECMEGGNNSDTFISVAGNDALMGRGGKDRYVIHEEHHTAREVTIVNLDYSDAPDRDIMELPWSALDIRLEWKNNPFSSTLTDLLLSSSTSEITVRLSGFSNLKNRHIAIRTQQNDTLYTLDVDSHGNAYLTNRPPYTTGDEPLRLYAVARGDENKPLELTAEPNRYGNLAIRDESGSGIILRGSQQGANLLVATAGDNQLYGGEKEDALYSGRHDDRLYGGGGDDSYYFAREHGKDMITDNEGKHSLHFTAPGLEPDDITLSIKGHDLEICAPGHDSNLVRVTQWQGRINNITLGNAFFLKGTDIMALVDTMAGFRDAELTPAFAPRLEEIRQRYWITVSQQSTVKGIV